MKKLSILALLVVTFATLALGVEYSDLSENHWAYDSVIKTTAGGLFIGFPDGTFRGNENVTRYQLAMTLARFMDYSDAGDAKLQEVVFALTKKVAGLSLEISDNKKNLVDFMAELRALEATVASLKDSGIVGNFVTSKTFDDTIAYLYREIDRLSGEAASANEGVAGLKADLEALLGVRDDIAGLDAKLKAVGSYASEIEALKNRATDLEVTVKLLGQALANQKMEENEQKGEIADLDSRIGVVENVANSLTSDLFALRKAMVTKDDLAALESRLGDAIKSATPDLEPFVTGEELNDKLSLMYTKILRIQDTLAKMPEVKYYDTEIGNIEAAIADIVNDVDESFAVVFDQVDANIARLDKHEKLVSEIELELGTKASSADLDTLKGKVTDLEVTSKMLSNAIIGANKRISNLDYVTPDQLTAKLNFLYKKLGLTEEAFEKEIDLLYGELDHVQMEVSANREMLEVAFDQIDANIARLDKYGKEIASLSKRTGDLEILASTLEDQVDSLTSITNTMAKQMYKLDKTKADKADLAAAEKRISSLEANDTVIEEKLLALEATQKQNITNTNAAIILSFVALAFGAVGLILK